MSVEVINSLTNAYDVFNKELLENKLTPCVVSLGKKANAYGVYMPNRWFKKNDKEAVVTEVLPELRMVPTTFKNRTTIEILSTLLHEMIHHWRATICEKPKRQRGHDKYWAEKMEELGLKPFNIKNPEKKTGHSCSHTIISGGLFEKIAQKLIDDGLKIDYYFEDKPKMKCAAQKPKKVKYMCPVCENTVKGVEGLSIYCNDCDTNFEVV